MPQSATPPASAVILAAGKGRRAGSDNGNPKQFRPVAGMPLLAHSLKTFERCGQIGEIIITAPEGYAERAEEIADKFGASKAKVIAGGKTRFESARLGFEQTKKDAEVVVFHDAARPFAEPRHIAGAICGALDFGAAVTAIILDDSIKKTHIVSGRRNDRYVKKTVARADVWRAQTPQAFRRELLAGIYDNFSGDPLEIGDEATLFERTGGEIIVIAGDRRNMKITTEEDFIIAEAIAESVKTGKFEDYDL